MSVNFPRLWTSQLYLSLQISSVVFDLNQQFWGLCFSLFILKGKGWHCTMKKLKWSFKFLFESNSRIGITFPQCLDLSFPWQHLTNRFYLWDRLYFVSSQCCCTLLSIFLHIVQVWILFWILSVFLWYMRDRPRFLRQLGGKLGKEVIRRHPGFRL